MRKFNFILMAVLSAGICGAQSGQSGTGANIDVKYHRFEWRIDPDAPKNIAGAVTTYFRTTQNNVGSINFDFNKTSFNNANLSVQYHGSTTGVSYSFPVSGNINILNILLPNSLAINTLDSVTIFYSGAPPPVNGEAYGYQKGTLNDNYIYTLSESYEDKDWWPCKADMQDKIDSSDFIITTPAAFTAITNGKLISNILSGNDRVCIYKHRYPIASYLVCLAIGKYNYFDRGTVNIGGTNVPVEYYILAAHGSNPGTQLTAMDFCKQELVLYSNLFGDYPFKNEKYGMYEMGLNLGMEHQTNSGLGFAQMSNWETITHELSHQWFGDKVTCGSWNNLWLQEGFATYCETLTAESIPSLGQNPASIQNLYKTTANSSSYRNFGCYIPNSYSTNSDGLWGSGYGRSVYYRGAMVVSMLRKLLGDAKFFQACRNYLNDPALAYRSATTEDLKNHMQILAGGFDLTGFFNDFVYGTGYPSTTVNWSNPSGNILQVSIGNQLRTAAGSTAYFHNVIPIRVQGASAGQDTTISIYDADGNNLSKAGDGIASPVTGNLLTYNLSFKPVTVSFDPFSTSLSTGVATKIIPDIYPHLIAFTVTPNGSANDALLTLDRTSAQVALERSADGTNFNPLGAMALQSSTPTEVKYFLRDAAPLVGFNYYRASYKNTLGNILYSPVIRLGDEPTQTFVIINNPIHRKIEIKTPASAASKIYSFNIYNAAGKLISKSEKLITGSITELISPVSPGLYILKLNSKDDKKQIIKFLVE